MPILVCLICGKRFRVTASKAKVRKYCSWSCAMNALEKRVVLKCSICGKDFRVSMFKAKKRKFCSKLCADKAKEKKVVLRCARCGKPFSVPLHLAKRNRRFCSFKCATYKGPVTLACSYCGKEFVVKRPSLAKARKFCSPECMYAAQKKRITKVCEVCERTFEVPLSRANARFCSKRCASLGPNNPAFRGGKFKTTMHFRRFVRSLLPSKCSICGWGEAACDVCHIVSKREGGTDSLDNIVILCPNHHRMLDEGKISREVLRLKALEQIKLIPPLLLSQIPHLVTFQSSNQIQ